MIRTPKASLAVTVLTALASVAAMAAISGCSSAAPPDLDVSLTHASAKGTYVVSLQPPAQAPAINQIHSWQVGVKTADGTPVRDARFHVDGGMPQHGHGLPTQPRVTRELADGKYLLEGMKFSMTGWWEIKLAVAAAGGEDTVTFNTVIADRAARP